MLRKELRCLFCIVTLRNTIFFPWKIQENVQEKYFVYHPRFHDFCWPLLRSTIPCLTRLWFNSIKPRDFWKGNLIVRKVKELFWFEGGKTLWKCQRWADSPSPPWVHWFPAVFPYPGNSVVQITSRWLQGVVPVGSASLNTCEINVKSLLDVLLALLQGVTVSFKVKHRHLHF